MRGRVDFLVVPVRFVRLVVEIIGAVLLRFLGKRVADDPALVVLHGRFRVGRWLVAAQDDDRVVPSCSLVRSVLRLRRWVFHFRGIGLLRVLIAVVAGCLVLGFGDRVCLEGTKLLRGGLSIG